MRVGSTLNVRATPKTNSRDFSQYILDDIPGAVLGHSLRRLTKSYNGNCIRLDTTINHRLLDVGFIENNYRLDYLDITSVAHHGRGLGDNIFAKIWYDQSGSGNNATVAPSVTFENDYVWDCSDPSRYYGFAVSNEGYFLTEIWPASKLFSLFFFNGLGEVDCLKFAAPSTDFTFYIVGSTADVTASNKNVFGTDGGGFNSSGIYIQNNAVVFARSGASTVAVSPNTPINSKLFMIGVQHYSNNTAKAFCELGEGPLTTITGGWTTGARSTFKLGSYYAAAVRQTANSLQGYICEIVAWPNATVPIAEIIRNVKNYYNL